MVNENCNHTLGILSSMDTIKIEKDRVYRKCRVCKKTETLRRAGKIYVGVSVAAESKRDFERREYAKDLLQPYDVRGNKTEEFLSAYGDPEKKNKSKPGSKMKPIKEKRKKNVKH